jgi:hypothetical protein
LALFVDKNQRGGTVKSGDGYFSRINELAGREEQEAKSKCEGVLHVGDPAFDF